MKVPTKRRIRMMISVCCALIMFGTMVPVQAENLDNLQNQSSELETELATINSDLLEMGKKIADVEVEINDTNASIEQIQETLAIAKQKEAVQYAAMKKRIKYMYENDDVSMLAMLCSAVDMQDFLNRADFIQNISEYDREQLSDLLALQATIENQNEQLQAKKTSLETMKSQLKTERAALKTKAEETSTDLQALNGEIERLKEEEARRKEEEERRLAEEAAKKAAEEAARLEAEAAKKEAAKKEAAKQEASASSGKVYNYPSGSGVLTRSKGVNYYNGHRETWYSQRVLPGGGLNIPGRTVRSDGVIVDGNGYVCVASEDYPKGTVVQTSLGTAKVYDCGCAKGTIDIYTDW